MRLNTSNSSLFALSSFFLLSTSLPFEPRNVVWVEPLVRRATYSVVPVDGGAAATSAGSFLQAAPTIIETIVQTEALTTKTIFETDDAPPVTDVVVSTRTIEKPDTTQTVLFTVTPSPATITATGYSIIDVSSPTVTIETPEPGNTESSSSSSTVSSAKLSSSSSVSSTSSSTRLSAPSSTTSCQTSSTAISTVAQTHSATIIPTPALFSTSYFNASLSTSSSIPTSTSSESGASSSSYTSTFTLSIESSTLSSTSTPSSSTTSYDNGQWHTTYPFWSNLTRTAVPSALPTLRPSPAAELYADSVPGVTA